MEGQIFEEHFNLTVFQPIIDEIAEPVNDTDIEIEAPIQTSNSTENTEVEKSTNTTDSVDNEASISSEEPSDSQE